LVNDLATRRLYLCTPIRDDLERFVADAIDGGVDIVQLRDKTAEARDVLRAGSQALAICRERRVPFILNDRADLALELGTDGVHVGQDDAPVSLCRRILGDDAIIGLSTHAPSELDNALATSATYLSAGPVVATPTKPGRAGTGVEYASEATKRADRPVFVTGGVSPNSVDALVEKGVRHFVVVRYLTEASDVRRAAHELRSAIDDSIARID
jgi:thiamine-phosphate pyrophosphorylase